MTIDYPINSTTEAGTTAALAFAAAGPHELPLGGLVGGIIPEGWQIGVGDLERYAPAPHRKRGNFRVDDVDSFLA